MLAGAVLAGAAPGGLALGALMAAISLLYVGGMYLNDAFDAGVDAVERPERPIPSGRVRARTVFWLGTGMLALGVLLLALVGFSRGARGGLVAFASGLTLAGVIILYDARHKQGALGPLLMGGCRGLIYICVGLALREALPATLGAGALVLGSYVTGLTLVARQERPGEPRRLWPLLLLAAPLLHAPGQVHDPLAAGLLVALAAWTAWCASLVVRPASLDVRRAVGGLVAGISLVDALLIAESGQAAASGIAVLGFLLTRAGQRFIPGS